MPIDATQYAGGGGNYLKGSDLPPGDHNVVISDVNEVHFEAQQNPPRDAETKLVLSFQNKETQLVLNKTNTKALIEAYGEDAEKWIGKPVILFTLDVNGPQGLTKGIRLRFPTPPSASDEAAAQGAFN